MSRVLISTKNCYTGRVVGEGKWNALSGSYSCLYDNPEVDKDTIEFNQETWDDEKYYFIMFLESEISKYEKRYKCDVVGIAMLGTVGRWNGDFFGGRVVPINWIKEILYMGEDINETDATVDEGGVIWVNGHHHDSTHSMKIHFLTKSKIKQAGLSPDVCLTELNNYSYLESLKGVLKPLKLPKKNSFFNQ